VVIALGAVIAAAVALILWSRAPRPAPASVSPNAVTIRLAVTPPDADVILDGVRVGRASEPLVLPRSDRRRALRIEKSGFAAQTVWIVPDQDDAEPPIALRVAQASAPVTGSALAKPPLAERAPRP